MRAFLAAVALALGGAALWGQAAEVPARSVLVLQSYQTGPEWTQDVTDGVMSVLTKSRDFRFTCQLEYLTVFDDEPSLCTDKLRLRLGSTRFDIVICADNQALDAVVDNRAALFAGIPIVFCSVDDWSPDMLKGETDITGITGEPDIEGTLDAGATTAPRHEAPARAGQP